MAPHSSTLAWKIPWTEEPGRLQSVGLLRVGHDWATSLSLFTFMHWRRKWQPTPVFLPGESQGLGEPGGLPSMGSHRVGHDWSDLAAAAAHNFINLCLELKKPLESRSQIWKSTRTNKTCRPFRNKTFVWTFLRTMCFSQGKANTAQEVNCNITGFRQKSYKMRKGITKIWSSNTILL